MARVDEKRGASLKVRGIRRAQYNIVYVLTVLVIAFIVLGSTFYLGTAIRNTNSATMSDLLVDDVLAAVEKNIMEVWVIANITKTDIITRTISIPQTLGGQTYAIAGSGKVITVKTFGPQAIQKRKTISWDVDIYGMAASSQDITLRYNATDSTIAIL